jgi:hypothetical protein
MEMAINTYLEPAQMEAFLQEVFGPDLVLPDQFFPEHPGSSALSGERALMWAVLVDGIESFRRTAHSRFERDLEEYAETAEWLAATDWDSVFSFVNLCEIFGFDPAPLRRALCDWEANGARAMPRQRFRPVALRAA